MKTKLFPASIFLITFLFLSRISFAQNTTFSNGNWLDDNQWLVDPYPSATVCYLLITVSHVIGVQNLQILDLSGCGAVAIIIDGGELRMGDDGVNGASLTLASGSTITTTNGGSITGVGIGTGSNATITIGGNEVWDGSDDPVLGEVVIDENSTDGLPVTLLSFTS